MIRLRAASYMKHLGVALSDEHNGCGANEMSKPLYTFGGRLRPKKDEQTNWENLVFLPNERIAFVYQRLSTHEQAKKSIYSRKAQDALKDLALEDGYPEELICVEDRDLGISGTKGREDRPGLAYLIELVEADAIESVYVVHISRLHRDQTLINALALGELLKERGVIIVTPQMRLNLKDKMHMRLYRMEVERAADELELMAGRLTSARDLKARAGFYGGESLPPGYVVDEREKLINGEPNPSYHVYQKYEPHAEVVQTIFAQLALPGMTATKVARYCKRHGIVFPPFSPPWNTKANRKAFARSTRAAGGGWPVTMPRVRCIATNPAYIGWKLWGGEVHGKNVYPPIIDEHVFWAVQGKFGRWDRPKNEYEPLPLAGLLYCGNHYSSKCMTYSNHPNPTRSNYRCLDNTIEPICTSIAAHILDAPISEAVVSQLTEPGVSGRMLDKLTSEYHQAKVLAASYRREMKRLEAEVDNLRGNLALAILPPSELQLLSKEIQNRLARIRELADLESQPIGAAVGRMMPGQKDIAKVKAFLDKLSSEWESQPNGLKNALLRLLLDRVTIWHNTETIRVELTWRVGAKQELLIHRAYKKWRKWTEDELKIMRECYETASQDELLALLPGRTWRAIAEQGIRLGLFRNSLSGQPGHKDKGRGYTPEEDELVRRYYAREIELEAIGRSLYSVSNRAKVLGLKRKPPTTTWEWLDDKPLVRQGESESRPTGSLPGVCCQSQSGSRCG
jgi:DNA invertase Pin-like site-specific DNA recombinase